MRHGESQANADGIFAGPSLKTSLTDTGRMQAKSEGARLKAAGIVFDTIIASPIERARETAEIVATEIGFDSARITIDGRLAEYDMGTLSGQPKAGVTARQRTSAPGAEDTAAFQARVMACLNDVRLLPGNTLLVAHAGVGGIIEATKRHSDIRDFYNEGYPNAQAVELDTNAILAGFNSPTQ